MGGAGDGVVLVVLRELRKQLAQEKGVAVYLIFTNEHLAEMVQQRATTKADLEKIVGVGSARVSKYGDPFLEVLCKIRSEQDEASRKPK